MVPYALVRFKNTEIVHFLASQTEAVCSAAECDFRKPNRDRWISLRDVKEGSRLRCAP